MGLNILWAQQTVQPGQINQSIPTSQTIADQPTKNYIRTYTYRNSSPTETNPQHVNVDVQYFDGLGRPVETVAVKASPTGYDMVTRQSYDSYGRADTSYLTFTAATGNNGKYTSPTGLSSYITSNYDVVGSDASYGFSRPAYEASPLNRLAQQGAPGAEWQPNTHAEQYAYQTNTAAVTSYKFTGNTYASFSYAIGKLYVNQTTDGDSKLSRTYTDLQGKVVMKEVYNSTYWMQTKYCYDDFGLLRCVIQPHVTTPDSTEGCFFYRYDAWQRMIAKKVPGSGWNYMIYDPRDRLVLTSDSVSIQDGTNYDRYYYTVYDDLNRPVEKGYVNTSYSRDYLRNYYSTNTVMFTSTNVYYTEKLYYDSHGPVRAACPFSAITNWVTASDTATSCKGLLTGKTFCTYYSTNEIPTLVKTEAYYYDKYGRVRQTVSNNFTSGTDRVSNVYNFAGQVTQTRYSHNAFTVSYTLDNYYTYDQRGRLLNTEYEAWGFSGNHIVRTIVSANVYNEAGLLKTKYLHSVKSTGLAFMQKVDYTYNVRGWLTGINDPGLSTAATDGDKFGMKLGYNRKPDGTSGTDICYNGNISGIKWGTPNYQNLQYLFTYNDVGWLKTATFSKTGFTNGSFNTTYTYYKNGNFNYITRKANNAVVVDQIRYGYNGPGMSRLKYSNDSKGDVANVDDFSGTLRGDTARYLYDGNGNLTSDAYKGLTIINDYQNHPKEIDIVNIAGNNQIKYFYNSTGEKMMRSVRVGTGTPTLTYYMGPFVHEGTLGGTSSLKFIITPEGRIVNSGTDTSPVWSWEYNLTDHLGNVRAVIAPTTTAGYSTLLQQTHYYPFGMRMSQISTALTTTSNDYLYNGKQYQDDFNLNWYDYGARFYDPALGRWHVIDPQAEAYYNLSPYGYCAGNPIINVDVNGEFIGTIIGTVVGGVAGAYDTYKKGGDVWAGFAEGAVSGAITGLAVDAAVALTVSTGGLGAVVVAGAAAGAIGGAAGAVAGDATGQVVTSLKEGSSISNAVSNINTTNMADKAKTGAVTGAIGGAAGGVVGKGLQAASNSTKALQGTMSKNITETAKTLTKMGADEKTVGTAVNKITTGMGEAGRNTVNTTNKVAAGTGMTTESAIKVSQMIKEERK